MSSYSWLRNEPAFLRVLSANLVSGIGDWFNTVAVFSLLLHMTGTGMSVGITLAIRTLPYLFLGPYAGIIVDRVNRKRLLIVCNLSSGCIALLFMFATSADKVWVVYAATLGLVVFAAFLNPARMAIVSQLVSEDHLIAANALNETIFGSVMAIGAFAGGVVTAVFGTEIAFVINAASFFLAGLLMMGLRLPAAQHSIESQSKRSESESTERRKVGLREVWPVMFQSRDLVFALILILVWPIGGGIMNVLLSVYAIQVFHAGNAGVGIMYGSLGVGFIFGGLAATRFVKWIRVAIIIGVSMEGLGHVLLSQMGSIEWGAVCMVFATLGAGVSNACVDTLIMQLVPQAMQGRVFSLVHSSANVVLSVFMVLGGFLLDFVNPRILGFSGGTVIILAALSAALVLRPAPRLRTKAAADKERPA